MLKRAGRHPVPAAIAGACAIAFSAILVRLADVSPETAALFRCVYALPALATIAVIEDRRLGRRELRDRRFAMVAGIFFAADLIFWHHAIAAVGAGLATVLGNLQVVMVGYVAWIVLGEKPTPRLLAAAPIALIGVTLISGVLTPGEVYGENPPLGVLFGFLTALMYTGFLLVLRRGSADLRRPAGPLLDATAVSAVIVLVYGSVTRTTDLAPEWPAHGWLVALALTSQVVGWLLITTSLPRLPAALTSVLLTIQPLGSVLLGIVILAEEPTPMQLAGVLLIVSALVIATARKRRAPEIPTA